MGWWTSKPGGTTVNLDDGYDETQGKMSDTAWDGAAASATVVSLLKKLASAGGGSAVSIADGSDVAQGSKADAAWVSGDGTVISLLKKIASGGGSAVSVADGADVAQGTTTDLASASTVVGLLKNIKAALAGSLTVGTHAVTQSGGPWTVTIPTPTPVSDNAGSLTVDAPVATPVFTRLSNGAVAIDTLPVSGPLTDTQLRAAVVPVGDGAGTLTVDAPVATPVFVRLSDGAAAIATLPVSIATNTPDVTDRSARLIGAPTFPTLTKGTLAATGLSVQEPKDTGRNVTNYFMAAMVALTNAEVMQSLTGYKSGAAVGATATPVVVSAGKIYRINRVTISFLAASAIGGALIRLRALSSGVALIGSPLAMNWHVGAPAIFTAGAEITYNFDYPDGLEFAAGFGIAIGALGEGADGVTATAVGKILVSIEGYEY